MSFAAYTRHQGCTQFEITVDECTPGTASLICHDHRELVHLEIEDREDSCPVCLHPVSAHMAAPLGCYCRCTEAVATSA